MGRRKKMKKNIGQIQANNEDKPVTETTEVPVSVSDAANSLSNLNMSKITSARPSTSRTPSPELVCCKHSSVYGRYLETTKFVKKGTLLISENVLVAGPLRVSNVSCVGCHTEIDAGSKSSLRCNKCQWPVCSDACMDSIYHQNECKFFTEHKIQAPQNGSSREFGALTVLRALLLKLINPEAWKLLNTLEHHNDTRRKLPLWEENEVLVVDVIQNKWKLGHIFNSKEEIHTVCGILEVNSFELGDTHSFRGLFPKTAMLAHNCVPNATQFIHTAEGKIDIRAAVDLPKGTPIYISYALSLQGTVLRQKSLIDVKFFECQCDRCMDSTELGTHLSTFKCQKCKTGFVLMNSKENSKSEAALSLVSWSWHCNNPKCGQSVGYPMVEKLNNHFYTNWEKLNGIESQEKFLKACEPYFHPHHYIPFQVMFDLCQAYGREGVSSINDLSQDHLKRKAALCTTVLSVLDKITPGHTITRAWILYELQATELVLCKRIFETGDFKKVELRRRLTAAMKILLEAIAIFGYSEMSSVECKIAEAAKQETLIGLQNWIDCLR